VGTRLPVGGQAEIVLDLRAHRAPRVNPRRVRRSSRPPRPLICRSGSMTKNTDMARQKITTVSGRKAPIAMALA